jgi:hypothetical protein
MKKIINNGDRYLLLIALCLTIMSIIGIFTPKLFPLISNTVITISAISVIIVCITLFFFYIQSLRKSLPAAYNIAVIGLPKYGKTTLLTTIFSEVLLGINPRLNLRLEGDTTIHRVNEDIETLKNGEALVETTDEDVHSYRATMEISHSILPTRYYQMEIGDFPGEDIEDFIKRYKHISNTKFFHWAIPSHAFIFIIDTTYQLESAEERIKLINKNSAELRDAWQQLLDKNRIVSTDSMRLKPLVLAFSKMDVHFNSSARKIEMENKLRGHQITASGPENRKVPQVMPILKDDLDTLEKIEEEKQRLLNDYNDLIFYLKNQSTRFSIVYTSCFATIDSRCLGISDLINGIVPR